LLAGTRLSVKELVADAKERNAGVREVPTKGPNPENMARSE
jgi:hypothetical protein